MLRDTRSGAARPSAHRKGSPKLYLRSSEVYFDAHCDHSLPHVIVASETTQHTPWTLKAFESHCRAGNARCTCWSSTNGSAATKCSAHPTGAQAGLKPLNGCRMTENPFLLKAGGVRDWVSTSSDVHRAAGHQSGINNTAP